MEEWKQIPGYPSYYISNLGRVKNKTGLFLKIRGRTPVVDFNQDGDRNTIGVARLLYTTFLKPIKAHSHIIYRDGDSSNLSINNLLSSEDRAKEIIEMYKNGTNFTTIANSFKISVKTVTNILNRCGISTEVKNFSLPKHSHKGKMEIQVVKGEYRIPYADNCTVKPKHFDANAYLLRQFNYNY